MRMSLPIPSALAYPGIVLPISDYSSQVEIIPRIESFKPFSSVRVFSSHVCRDSMTYPKQMQSKDGGIDPGPLSLKYRIAWSVLQ